LQGQYAEARYNDQMALYATGNLNYTPTRFTGKFSSFVFEFVKVRLMGIRDRTKRRLKTMHSLDTFYEVESNEDEAVSYAVFFGVPDSEYLNIEVRELLERTYSHLVKITQPTKTRNFPELFLQTVNDAFNNAEGFDRERYAKQKGITVSAVSMQLRELRAFLEQCGLHRDICAVQRRRDRDAGYTSI